MTVLRPKPASFHRGPYATLRPLRRAGAAAVVALGLAVAPLAPPFAGPAWAQAHSPATELLFRGVETGDLPSVREGLLAGADMTAKNAQGRTAADLAVDLGHFQIAQFLLAVKSYADANADVSLAQAIQAVVGGKTATSGGGRDVSGVLAQSRTPGRQTAPSRVTASDDLFGATALGLQPAPAPAADVPATAPAVPEPAPATGAELATARQAMDEAMAEVGDLMSRLEEEVGEPTDEPAPAPQPALEAAPEPAMAPRQQAAAQSAPASAPKAAADDVSGLLGGLTEAPQTPAPEPAPAVRAAPKPAAKPARAPRVAEFIAPAPAKPKHLAMAAPAPKPAPPPPDNVFDGMAQTLGLAPLESVETPTAAPEPAAAQPPAEPAARTAPQPEPALAAAPAPAPEVEAERTPVAVAERRTRVTQPPPGFPLPPGFKPEDDVPAVTETAAAPEPVEAPEPAEAVLPAEPPEPQMPAVAEASEPQAAEEAEEEGGLLDQVFDLFGSDPEPEPEPMAVAEAPETMPGTMPETMAEPAAEPALEIPAGTLTAAPETPEGPVSAVPADEPAPMFAVEEPAATAQSLPAPAEGEDSGFLSSLRELVETGPEAKEEEIGELLTKPMTEEQRVLRERARAKFAADSEARAKELERIAAEQKAEREARAAERLAQTQAAQRRAEERERARAAGEGQAVARANPGYVAPPDGGTSGQRFLDRLGGLFGIEPDPEPRAVTEAEQQSIAEATGRPGPLDKARMMPKGTTTMIPGPIGQPRTEPSDARQGGLIDQISELFAFSEEPAVAETGPMVTEPAGEPAGRAASGIDAIAPMGRALPVRGGRGPSAATQPLPDETVDFFDRLARNLGLDPAPPPDPVADARSLPRDSLLASPAEAAPAPAPAPEPAPTTTVAQAEPPQAPAEAAPAPAPAEGLFSEDIIGNLPGEAGAGESGFWGESDSPAPADAPSGLFASETEPPGAFDRAPETGTLDASGEAAAQPPRPKEPPPPAETWTVKNVQTARLPPDQAGDGALDDLRTETLLSGAGLTIGDSANLGRPLPSVFDQSDLKKSCLFKRRNTITVCIEPLDWPETLAPLVLVNTVMYQGLNAIVRYDNGVATRYHVLFPSEVFDTVIAHYVDKYGSPSEVWRRTIAPLAAPREENPTVLWRNMNPTTQALATLEIRKYDDTRGGFPDTRRGVLMLYAASSDPVFPQVSSLELMRLRPIGAPAQ